MLDLHGLQKSLLFSFFKFETSGFDEQDICKFNIMFKLAPRVLISVRTEHVQSDSHGTELTAT